MTTYKNGGRDSDDDDDDDAPNEDSTVGTKTITIKYKTPYDNNNACVFLKDESGYEHELSEWGSFRAPVASRSFRDDGNRPAQCARIAIQYLVWGDGPWITPWD